MKTLTKDPLNLVIIGVAGQGNVVISLLISQALVSEGYLVTFGQVFGGPQRGGTVGNYVRVSKKSRCAPLLLKGQADIILALEPMEALRMLGQYGKPEVNTIVNPRPIYSFQVNSGRAEFPDYDKILEKVKELSAKTWVIDATEEALKLGDARAANVLLTGALIGLNVLPLDRKALEPLIKERYPKAFERNMKAFARGMELVAGK